MPRGFQNYFNGNKRINTDRSKKKQANQQTTSKYNRNKQTHTTCIIIHDTEPSIPHRLLPADLFVRGSSAQTRLHHMRHQLHNSFDHLEGPHGYQWPWHEFERSADGVGRSRIKSDGVGGFSKCLWRSLTFQGLIPGAFQDSTSSTVLRSQSMGRHGQSCVSKTTFPDLDPHETGLCIDTIDTA